MSVLQNDLFHTRLYSMAKHPEKQIGKQKEYAENLAKLLLENRDVEGLQAFLLDFLTPIERKELWERWRIVELLLSGVSQRDIRDELSISISKVTRGSHAIQKGTGAFLKAWNKRKHAQNA